MRRGIPRPGGGIPRPGGGIPRPGTRLPAVVKAPVQVVEVPVQVVKAPVQVVPGRVTRIIAAPKAASKVRSAPVIPIEPKFRSRVIARGPAPQVISKPTLLPSRPTRQSFGFTRKVARPVPVAVPVVAPVVEAPVISTPVVTLPPSPVMVRAPSPVIVRAPSPVIAPVSPVRVVVPPPLSPRTPPSAAIPFSYSPVSPLGSMLEPEEFGFLSPPSPVGRMPSYSYSPDLATEIANMSVAFGPEPAFSPVRSPSAYGYEDLSPITGEAMPLEFSMLPPNLLVSPLGQGRGFRPGRARVDGGLFNPPPVADIANTTIEWESPEALVSEYNPVDLVYTGDDLMYYEPGDLINFSPRDLMNFSPGGVDLMNFSPGGDLMNFSPGMDLIQF